MKHDRSSGILLRALGLGCLLGLAGALLGACAQVPAPLPSGGLGPPLIWRTPWRAVLVTDLHFYEPALGTFGPAWARVQGAGLKRADRVPELWAALLEQILADPPDLVLIPGDLTLEGEIASHESLARDFARLEARGIRVLAVPGNHDLNNPAALAYTANGPQPTPAAGPEDWRRIYAGRGWPASGAPGTLDQSPFDLSYLAEPLRGLWVLGLDSVRWQENPGRRRPVTGGRLRPGTRLWADRWLARAQALGQPVVVMLHHGVLPNYPGQAVFQGEYLVAEYEDIGRWLARRGVRLVLTGHDHTVNLARAPFGADWLLDLESGSLATPPHAWRSLTLIPGGDGAAQPSAGLLQVRTHEAPLLGDEADFLAGGLVRALRAYSGGLLSPEDSAVLARGAVPILGPYLAGRDGPWGRARLSGTDLGADLGAGAGPPVPGALRRPPPWPPAGLGALGLAAAWAGQDLVDVLSHDPDVPDRNVRIDLGTGQVEVLIEAEFRP